MAGADTNTGTSPGIGAGSSAAPAGCSWYAVKVFYNRVRLVRDIVRQMGIEMYEQGLIPTLIFIRSTRAQALELRQEHYETLMVYRTPDRSDIAPIPDHEMAIFQLVTSSGEKGFEYLGDDAPQYHEGDRVRVTQGPLKGAEGHVKRIKKDRRLIVTVSGVAAIATAHIPDAFLEKIEQA